MKQRQSGSAHAVLIIILVIAVVGLLGFVFWQNFLQPKNEPVSTTNSTTKTESSSKEDVYATWLSYTSDRAGFTVKYPADWKRTDTSDTPGQLVQFTSPTTAKNQSTSPDQMNYDVDISFENTSGSMIASQLIAVTAFKESEKGGNISQYATKKYTETINGLTVTEFDMLAQSPYFAAVTKIGDYYVQLSFPTAPTKADLSTDLAAILASIKAN